MGGDKPSRRLNGRPLLDHALAASRAWSDSVAVCVRRPGQIECAKVRILTDVPDIPGPLAGLTAALDWARDQGSGRVLVIPCDMPLLPADLARRLDAALAPEVGVAVAASGGRPHPVCALWRTRVRPLLDRQARDGRLSLTALAERAGVATAAWPDAPFDPFANINTQADLARIEARLARPATG